MSFTIYAYIVLAVLLINASVQITAIVKIKTDAISDPKMKAACSSARTQLIISVVLQFLVAFGGIGLMVYSKGAMAYSVLLASSTMLLVGGSFGANSAIKMQCYKDELSVHEGWLYSTISSVIGILTTFIILLINTIQVKDVPKINFPIQMQPFAQQ